ncbi:hypothetical protein HDZ31DRAFT_83184 [Schizophyllum fasciatum]
MPPARFYELQSLAASASLTNFTPTAPGPGDVFTAGQNCTIQWAIDQSGSWNNVTIDLMSGANNNMSFVANVASNLDGSDASNSPFNWTCPEVNPYSDIYFYQFTNGGDTQDAKWTTRFTIASPSGEVDPPENPNQPDGSSIPWGVGHISYSTAQAESEDDAPSADENYSTAQAAPATTTSSKQKSPKHSNGASSDKKDKEYSEEDDEEDEDRKSSSSASGSSQRQKHSDDESKPKHGDSGSKSSSGPAKEDEDDDHSDDDGDHKHPEKDKKKSESSDDGENDDDDRHSQSSKENADDDGQKHATHEEDEEEGTHSAKTKSTSVGGDDSASSSSAAKSDDRLQADTSSSRNNGRPAGSAQSPLTMSLPPSAKNSVDTIVHSEAPYAAGDRASNSAEAPSLPVAALVLSYSLLFLVFL